MQTSQDLHTTHYNNSIICISVTGIQLIVYLVFSLFAILLCYTYDRWKRQRFEILANKLNGPPDYPIIGSALEFIGTERHDLMRIYRELYNSEPFKFWFGSNFTVFISKPEDLQIILNSSQALNKNFIYAFVTSITGIGLITAPVDKWKIHRRLINPLFKYTNIKDFFFPIFNEKSEILIQNLQKEVGKTEPFNILEYVLDISLSSICQTTLEYNLDNQSDMGIKQNVAKGLELIADRITKPWLYPDIIYYLYSKLFGIDKVYAQAKVLPKYLIEKKKSNYAQKIVEKNNIDTDVDDDKKNRLKGLVPILLEVNKAGVGFSEEEIVGHGLTIIGAGFETSTLTVSGCLLLLAIYPDIQDKVYNEINNELGDSNKPITIEQTSRLVYLKQVIHETLRLCPVAPFFARTLQEDVTIFSGNHTLPKGTSCFISPLITHFIPELYPNPESFNPDNFNVDNIAKRHKYSFIAFSGGPRGCIGKKYGLLFITVLLTDILRNFSVHTDIKFSDIKFKANVSMKSEIGYPITIRPRK